jgi:serine protease DegQ
MPQYSGLSVPAMMPRLSRSLSFLLRSAVFGLAVACVLILLRPELAAELRARLGTAPEAAGVSTATAAPEIRSIGAPSSYADAVGRASPSVVSVYVSKLVTERSPVLIANPTLQRFTGITLGPARQRLQRAQGSGVIVGEDGYILTNHHVVAGADEIQTVLWDGRVTQARIVGSDADTDLAVLKIDGNNLPALPLSSAEEMRVGDVVLAIGNPFGLGQTVTQGIVSGLGRNQLRLQGTVFQDFIQTDAAINEGNSGGALVDAGGRLIGINTFVLGRMTAGAEGIGFAIPVRTAKAVFDQIVDHGLVVRGWLGADYGDAPVLPGTVLGAAPRGVAVTQVYSGGPAEAAGLQPGDVLLQFDGSDIIDQADLRDREAAVSPGATIAVAGLRAGVPFTAELVLTQRPVRSA